MKNILFLILSTFMLHGCYSGIGLGVGTDIGNGIGVGSNVQLGSDGQIHGSIGMGIGGSL